MHRPTTARHSRGGSGNIRSHKSNTRITANKNGGLDVTRSSRGATGNSRNSHVTTSGSRDKRSFSSYSSTRRRSAPAPRRSGRNLSSFDPSRFINTNPISITTEAYTPKHTFNCFGFVAGILKNLAALGMITPSPIQDQVISEIMQGKDVVGLAETGTGKTAAFLLPLIQKTIRDTSRRTLILAPTRELAIQIDDEFRKLSRGFRLFSVTCVGGVNIYPQIKALRRTNHFVIGTPGRVLDLIKRRILDNTNITTVVLDEADRMLDMGFINDIRTILATTPATRETLLFSATMTSAAQKLVKDFLRDPIAISVKKKEVTDSIEQNVVRYARDSKFETLTALLSDPTCTRALVFCSMKHGAERLARDLCRGNIEAESIHGNKNHNQRQRALQKFKSGAVQVLVATDVAARGIHVENITHVINYDLPNTLEDYIHRIGRTGRAAMRGKALTFVVGA